MDWGKVNYVNPPFRREDALNGRAITDFAKKAIEEQREGNTSVLLLPTVAVINLLLEAGAEMRPLGRVAWLHADTGEAWRSPHNVTAFILRGRRRVPSKRPAP